VSAPPAVATPLPEIPLPPNGPYQNPPRFSYPKEVLKHRFLPYGAQSSGGDIAQEDVEMLDAAELEESTGDEPPVKEVKEKKSKKRKVDGDSPKKKLKKVKTDVAT
jgi:hypothetical protein